MRALIALALTLPISASAMNPEEYARAYPPTTTTVDQQAIVARCLNAWGPNAPFKTAAEQSFRVIRPQVRVMGLGGQEISDRVSTDHPVLVLIEPSVSVMTKTTFRLLNPNAWYCFDANVTVMGKSVVQVDCNAKLADGRTGVTVIGTNAPDKRGVTVMGSTEVQRLNCKTAPTP